MRRLYSIAFVIALVAVAAYLYRGGNGARDVPSAGSGAMLVYENPKFYLSFRYPSTYELAEEHGAGDGSILDVIELVKRDRAGGSVAHASDKAERMTIEVFGKPKEATARQWVEHSTRSHRDSIVGPIATTTIAGAPGVLYHWHESTDAESVVTFRDGHAYLFTVTYASATDPIRADFMSVFSTLTLPPA